MAKEIIQVEASNKQLEFNVDQGIDDSSGPCKVEGGIFDMEDLGEAKGDKTPLTEQQPPSIRINYSSLPRSSKRKLYELLNSWSEWHAQNCLSEKVGIESVEDGEETFFPALHVGLDKPSTMSFWMDGQVRKRQRTEALSVDDDSAPMYDRNYPLGMALDGGSIDENRPLDLRDAARCFNCGSYSHSLKECSKPYNNVAVSNARKEFQSKKNKNSSPRLRTRYYQDSPSGKYDGLKPGCLSAETRELLGLKDLEPPPWLSRMRQIGYPPGYLDSEENDQPSGITIFGDETNCQAGGNNESKSVSKCPQKKMSVGFPGINAPIPANADPKDWEKVQGLSNSEFPGSQPDKMLNHPRLPQARGEAPIPAPPYNLHSHDLSWSHRYNKSPSFHYRHYSYESPPPTLHDNYESPHLPPLDYSHPYYFQDSSPRGIPIPRSPGPHGYISPQFISRSPTFPGDRFFQNHSSPA